MIQQEDTPRPSDAIQVPCPESHDLALRFRLNQVGGGLGIYTPGSRGTKTR